MLGNHYAPEMMIEAKVGFTIGEANNRLREFGGQLGLKKNFPKFYLILIAYNIIDAWSYCNEMNRTVATPVIKLEGRK